MNELVLFDKIRNFKGKTKIKEIFFYEKINFWNALRSLFYLYHLNINNTKNKKNLYIFKKKIENNLFNNKKSIQKTEIIFFNTTFGRYNKKDFSPFYKPVLKLVDEDYIEVSYIELPSFLDISTYNSFNFEKRFPFQMFIKDFGEKEILEKNKKIFSDLKKEKSFIEFLSNLFKIKDTKPILDSLEYIFCEGFCETLRTYNGHKKMLRLFRPKILILLSGRTIHTYTAILAAKELGIKTIEIRHGIPASEFNFPKNYVFPDKICVYGKKDYESYLNAGVPKEILEITGDVRVNESPKKKKKTKNEYKKVLWLTTGISNKHATELSEIIFKFVKENNLDLTIKMHPDDTFYLTYKKESILSNRYCKITKKTNLLKHIKESDFIICGQTTAIVDVIANYKPILFENIEKKDKLIFNYFDKTTFYDNTSLENAFQHMKTKCSEKDYNNLRKKILEDFSYDYGNGAKQIAKIIKEILAE